MSEPFTSIRSPYRSLDPESALEQPTSILLGVSQSAANALDDVDISTVFDLASSTLFANAVDICLLAESGEGRFAATGRVPHDALRNGYDKPIKDLPLQPISVLGGRPSKPKFNALAAAIDIASIRDLAAWSPYRTARELLDRVYNPLAISGVLDLEAPADLVPDNGQYPTERVQYEVLLFDGFASEEPRPNTAVPAPVRLGSDGALDVAELVRDSGGYERPAIGGVLTFTQSWYTKGLALGNLIHGVALGPGESTKIAMIDWSRRTRAGATEAIQEDELLVSDLTRTRSISEITSAVAHETQKGTSGAKSFALATQSGKSTGGANLRDPSLNPFELLSPGVSTSGTSSSISTGFTDTTSWSTSSGDRDVSATLSQDIADRTHQASHSARNRRASIVREVSQEESESISTRTLTNYNHMHALTVEYYEVVQLYRTIVELTKADRCLFVPMKVINFGNSAVVNRFRRIIAAAGLNPQVQVLSILEPDHVAVVAPHRVRPWSRLEEMEVATGEALGTPESTVLVLPRRFADSFRFGFGSEAPIDQTIVTFTSGESHVMSLIDTAAGEGAHAWNPRFQPETGDLFNRAKSGRDFSEIARIEFVKKSGNEDYEGDLFFMLSFDGSSANFKKLEAMDRLGAALTTIVHVPKDVARFTAFEFTESIADDDLIRHLNDNALYYSQAVWRALDPATIGILLSGYAWTVGGQAKPLVELVDPRPVAIVANYLVLRMSGDDAKEHAAWLGKKNLKVPSSLREDLVPVPSGGVFAEAVLGRFNSAEKLDITRFWNWQDSPIPIEAPDIAAIQAGSRGEPDDTTPGQLGAPVLNILNSPALPDPQGMGAVLAAIQNGNMFRDMSGLAATIGLAQAGLAGAQQGATAAASQAGQNAAVAAELGAKVAELAAKIVAAYFTGGASAAVGAGGGELAGLAGGISGQGAKLNKAKDIDNERGVPGGGTGAGSEPSTNGEKTDTPSAGATSKEIEAFDSFLPGGGGPAGILGQLLLNTIMGQALAAAKPSLALSQKVPDPGPGKKESDVVGSITAPVVRGTPEFSALVENKNPNIVFKDEEKTGADRMMTPRLQKKLDDLADLVTKEWPGKKLRVTEAWDEDMEHTVGSIHYEGRAADITVSDGDTGKLGRLCQLAVDAGFDFVWYENAFHGHVSVIK
jgi:hypothetical protein